MSFTYEYWVKQLEAGQISAEGFALITADLKPAPKQNQKHFEQGDMIRVMTTREIRNDMPFAGWEEKDYLHKFGGNPANLVGIVTEVSMGKGTWHIRVQLKGDKSQRYFDNRHLEKFDPFTVLRKF